MRIRLVVRVSLQQLPICGSQILSRWVKAPISTTLLTSIFVKEGVLLAKNYCLTRAKPDKHIQCVVLGAQGGSSKSPEPPLDPPLWRMHADKLYRLPQIGWPSQDSHQTGHILSEQCQTVPPPFCHRLPFSSSYWQTVPSGKAANSQLPLDESRHLQ